MAVVSVTDVPVEPNALVPVGEPAAENGLVVGRNPVPPDTLRQRVLEVPK